MIGVWRALFIEFSFVLSVCFADKARPGPANVICYVIGIDHMFDFGYERILSCVFYGQINVYIDKIFFTLFTYGFLTYVNR